MKDADLPAQPFLPGLELVAALVDHTDDGKSNTVEMFDALVVYSVEHAREGARYIETQKRFRGQTFTVRVMPANVKRADGRVVPVLPGMRENLVEKALRKIAAEDLGNLGVTDKDGNAEVWVKFTLHQLRRTLAEQGHEFKISQLVEALDVLQGAIMTYAAAVPAPTPTEEGAIQSGILQTVVWRRKKKGDQDGREYRVAAKLHPLITKSILQRTFRQIDFGRLMKPKNELARWLYMKLSHNYTQASESDLFLYQGGNKAAGYHLALSTIIRETGSSYTQTRDALRAVRTALAILRKHDVLLSKTWVGQDFRGWAEEVTRGPAKGGRPPVQDVVFTLFPSLAVIEDIIKANEKGRQMMRRK